MKNQNFCTNEKNKIISGGGEYEDGREFEDWKVGGTKVEREK